MSQQCNAVIRMIRLSCILTDITDIVLPVSKELARCLKYSVHVEKKVTGMRPGQAGELGREEQEGQVQGPAPGEE